MTPELVVDARAQLGEGPCWQARTGRLMWVDIEGGKLHVHDPEGEPDAVYEVGMRVGAAVPRIAGGLLLATEQGFQAFDLDARRLELVADPESHLPDNRFNDGKCDPRGRFWAGTMSMTRQPRTASLYVLEPGGSVRRVLEGVTTSNGLDWTEDGKTMYYIDTPTLQVAAFDYDEEQGTIAGRRVVVQFPDGIGRPDGMTLDREGMLWVAHWSGGRVSRWDPAGGRMLAEVKLPATNVTSCAFGGPDLDRLYITTARHRLDEETLAREPHAGGLFAIEPGVAGRPSYEFAG